MLSKKHAVMAAALVAGLGLGALLGIPGVSLAQEDPTTTVDSTEQGTDTTATDESADKDRTDGAGRGECEQGQSSEDASTEG